MAVEVFGTSIQGKRSRQEDNIYYQSKKSVGMAIVCDGMGGLEEGDWASHIAVELFKKHFNKLEESTDIKAFYQEEIPHLDDVICRLVDDQDNRITCGTTMVSAVVKNNELYWASIGDSKIYIYSRKRNMLTCLNRLHNYRLQLDMELSNQMITKEQYESEMKIGESLISFLGMGNVNLFDIGEKKELLDNGDIVILCSDGIYKSVNENEMISLICQNTNTLEDVVENVIEMIKYKNARAQDNASIIMMRCV